MEGEARSESKSPVLQLLKTSLPTELQMIKRLYSAHVSFSSAINCTCEAFHSIGHLKPGHAGRSWLCAETKLLESGQGAFI